MFPLGRAISQEIRSPDAAVPEEYTYSLGAPPHGGIQQEEAISKGRH